jgi:hypothetical protein
MSTSSNTTPPAERKSLWLGIAKFLLLAALVITLFLLGQSMVVIASFEVAGLTSATFSGLSRYCAKVSLAVPMTPSNAFLEVEVTCEGAIVRG